jgi:hypothetical protein
MKEPNGKTGAAEASHRRGLAGATFPAVRGDILPKADSERAATCVAIRDWMEKVAPGAAEAARMISREKDLSEPQRQRLARLTDEKTRPAWEERPGLRQKSQRELSADELRSAHHEMMFEAFRAPEFPPIGRSEIDDAKAKLAEVGAATQCLANEIREVGTVGITATQLWGMWNTYRNRRPDDEILAKLPGSLPSIATALDGLADFFQQAASLVKPGGPISPVGQPKDRDALKTSVIRQIGKTCKKHFKTEFYSTVARLANAALDRDDIDSDTVRGSLPRKKVRKSKQGKRPVRASNLMRRPA